MSLLLGIDVGGTFTDAVLLEDGRLLSAKVPSTEPQSRAVTEAACSLLAKAGRRPEEVERFVHGMTVATNALLERRGARVALVTTEGFRDLLLIGRQERSLLYTFYPRRPAPLVPRKWTLTVRERVGPAGAEQALEPAEAERVAQKVAELEPEAVAVCLLWSFVEPAHEVLLREVLEERLPGLPIVASSDLAPVFREYERMSTTVVDAYVTPCTRGYLLDLARACSDLGLREPEVMQSSAGTASLRQGAAHAANLLLSGPAGGVLAARLLGDQLGLSDVLSFDMGGTSTDCAALPAPSEPPDEHATDAPACYRGHLTAASASASRFVLETSTERTVAGLTVRLPMVDIHTVSAGGGSIAWVDEGGALKVGPRSVGAHPGPACYGWGGSEATVTDANVVLGRIAPAAAFGGSLRLKRGLAREAVGRLAQSAGLPLEAAAEGILRVAVFNMAAALRKVTLERGVDPRGFTLVAFGGAGGLHACALADEVGIRSVVVPYGAGVLSALGLALSPPRTDLSATVMWRSSEVALDEWNGRWEALEEAVLAKLRQARTNLTTRTEVVLRREIEARYRGQSHELTLVLDRVALPGRIASLFHAVHERRYGYSDTQAEVEIVTIRVVGVLPLGRGLPTPRPIALRSCGWVPVSVDGCTVDCPFVTPFLLPLAAAEDTTAPGSTSRQDRGQRLGDELIEDVVRGPALVSAAEFSAWVAPGWSLRPVPEALLLERDS